MKIKICGIRNVEELDEVRGLDYDYLGFVFSKSKRKISYEEYETLSNTKLNLDKVVSVFKDESLDFVIEGIERFDFKYIQLHGEEDLEYIDKIMRFRKLSKKNFKIFKGVSINNFYKFKELEIYKFILDGEKPGSGIRIDLKSVKEKFSPRFLREKVILSGGLSPYNIEDILKEIEVYGVDVSSGVEKDGLKNRENVEGFIRKVRCNYDKREI